VAIKPPPFNFNFLFKNNNNNNKSLSHIEYNLIWMCLYFKYKSNEID
jgi:hypothetical protein